ncbi:MAG: site-specific integrase [Acidobacteriota bacterium]
MRFDTEAEAKKWGKRIEVEIDQGLHDIAGPPKKALLVGDLLEERKRLDLKDDTKAHREGRTKLDWWSKRVGEYRADKLPPKVVLHHLEELTSGRASRSGEPVSDATANRYLAALGAAYRRAVKSGDVAYSQVPTRRLGASEVGRERKRWLSDAEHPRLLEAIRGKDVEIWVLLGMTTGSRLGEIAKLEWRHLDLVAGTILHVDTKNGEARQIPLLPRAKEILAAKHAQLDPGERDEALKGPRGGVKFNYPQWHQALEAAEIDDFHFHDLRHTAGAWLAQAGFSLRELADILGHRTLAMVKRYTHFAQGQLVEKARAAMQARGAETGEAQKPGEQVAALIESMSPEMRAALERAAGRRVGELVEALRTD